MRKNLLWLLCAGLLLCLLGEGAAAADDLKGRVQLLAKGGKGPAQGASLREAVIYYEPVSPQPVRPPAEAFVMTTERKEFVPRVLAIPRGSRVRFPNSDPILHNVFSVAKENSFDLGLYRKGPGKEKKLTEPGLVRVYCNVHHDMVGYILVLDTPYFTSPDANGEFVLKGVPRGQGRLTVWHEQTDPWTVDLQLPAANPVSARIEVVRQQVPPHLNKSGESYFRRDRYKNR